MCFKNADINTTRKTILFCCFHPDRMKNKRIHYALRWVNNHDVSSARTLNFVEDELKFKHFFDGKGCTAYDAASDSFTNLWISRNDIMFGGITTRSDSLKFGT